MLQNDETLSTFLEIGGVKRNVASAATDEMRLLHDLGMVGDNAWEGLEYLHKKCGVVFDGFEFNEHFPSETSFAACMLGASLTRKSRIGRHLGQRYKAITIGDIKRIIDAKHW